jgi:hypothetical protein
MKNPLWLLLIPLLLLTTGLAARNLNADAVWYDEYWSLYNVGSPPNGSRTLIDIWNANLATNLWEPPGYYLMLGAWGGVVGWTHFASRTLSLLFGLLAVAMTYRLGRDLFSPTVGLGAAVTLGVSAFFIDYLHEIRNYTIFVFLIVYILWAYWRIIQRVSAKWHVTGTEIGFVLALAAAMYLHYYAMLPIAVLALYHLLFVFKRNSSSLCTGRGLGGGVNQWWRIVILMGIAGLLYLPWAGMALQGLAKAAGGVNYVIPTLTPVQVGRLLAYTFSNASGALLGLLVGLALTRRDRPAGFVWFIAAGILAGMLLVDARLKILIHIRHLLALWPLLALLVGLGIERLAKGGIHPAWPIAVWIAAGLGAAGDPAFVRNLPNTEPRLDWQGLSATLATLREKATADDVLVFHVPAGDQILSYYTEGLPAPFQRTESFFYSPDPNAGYPANASAFMDEAARVWYVTAPEMPPFYQEAEFKGALLGQHVLCDVPVELSGMRLERYAKVPAASDFQFGEGISLTVLDAIPAEAETSLPLLFGWRVADDVPRGKYSALLHVEDAAGQLTAADYGLPEESFGCRATKIPLAAGEYKLWVGVYDWQTLERLPAKNLSTGDEGERLLLTEFRITE